MIVHLLPTISKNKDTLLMSLNNESEKQWIGVDKFT